MSTSNHPFLEFPQIKPPLLMMGRTLKWKPNSIEIAPSCPRCFSTNTKFCYYNNYSVSQPRYFCKSCRRYWTKGGSLRNVPVGGGCRKSRRGRSSRREASTPPPSPPAAAAAEPENAEVAAASSGVKDYESGGATDGGGDERLRHVHGSMDGGDFVYENFDVFEVNGVGSEMVWSDFGGFGSEQQPPLMEMQGFEVFSSDENLITENWGSFDLENF